MLDKRLKNLSDIKLIALDELHRVGAETWNPATIDFISKCTNAKVLGLTATPIRHLDRCRNMAKELFDGVEYTELSMEDAFRQGILNKPLYITRTLDLINEVKLRITKAVNVRKESEVIELLKQYGLHDGEKMLFSDEDKYAVNALSKYLKSDTKDNSKHLVFCSTVDMAEGVRLQIKSWFQEVYKDKQINVYMAHCKNKKSSQELLEFSKYHEDSVDILISINLVNEGIHVDNITSLIMLRKTTSLNVFIQQIGRLLSTNIKHDTYIFDFVGNSEFAGRVTKNYGDLLTDQSKVRQRYSVLKNVTQKVIDEDTDIVELVGRLDKLVNIGAWDIAFNDLKSALNEMEPNKRMIYNVQNEKLRDWGCRIQYAFISDKLQPEELKKFASLGMCAYITPRTSNDCIETMLQLEKWVSKYGKDSLYNFKVNSKKGRVITDLTMQSLTGKMQVAMRKYLKDIGVTLVPRDEYCKKHIKKSWLSAFEKLVMLLNKAELTNEEEMDATLKYMMLEERIRYKNIKTMETSDGFKKLLLDTLLTDTNKLELIDKIQNKHSDLLELMAKITDESILCGNDEITLTTSLYSTDKLTIKILDHFGVRSDIKKNKILVNNTRWGAKFKKVRNSIEAYDGKNSLDVEGIVVDLQSHMKEYVCDRQKNMTDKLLLSRSYSQICDDIADIIANRLDGIHNGTSNMDNRELNWLVQVIYKAASGDTLSKRKLNKVARYKKGNMDVVLSMALNYELRDPMIKLIKAYKRGNQSKIDAEVLELSSSMSEVTKVYGRFGINSALKAILKLAQEETITVINIMLAELDLEGAELKATDSFRANWLKNYSRAVGYYGKSLENVEDTEDERLQNWMEDSKRLAKIGLLDARFYKIFIDADIIATGLREYSR